MKPRLYDQNMNMIGVLQNASRVGFTHKTNDLYTAKFELPVNDAKNDLCQTFNIVDIFDGEESKGKYRILDNPEAEITADGAFIEYSCEHVIAFLLNDVIDGYLELGGTNFRTSQVLTTLLNKQLTKRWRLGRCDFDRRFQYSWENTSLLDAIFSVPNCFDENYRWTYDTSTYPWTLNLIRADTARSCEIRRKRNMTAIKRTIDSSQLVTRLYCKGYGEGINQLTIAEVNNGKPYIDADSASIAKYGIVCGHLIDRRYTNMEHLLAYGRAVLEKKKTPIVSYSANAIDLNKITGYDWDKYDEGRIVHIIDEDKKLDLDAMIIEVSKDDVDGEPLSMEISISNKSADVASDIEDMNRRATINSQYSQGATNLYCEQFADNADSTHPAKMKIYVPNDCTRINQVLLTWSVERFRAYSKSAAAGGANTLTSADGGATTVTSASGGSTTVTSAGGGASTYTSSDGGSTTVTSAGGGSSTYTSSDGGSSTVTSASGGGETVTSAGGGEKTVTSAAGGEKTVTSAGGGEKTVTSAGGGEKTVTSAGGGDSTQTSSSGGGASTATGGGGNATVTVGKMYISSGLDGTTGGPKSGGSDIDQTGVASTSTMSGGDHWHYLYNWGHQHGTSSSFQAGNYTLGVYNYDNFKPYTGSDGSHTHSVYSHNHGMWHTHKITSLDFPSFNISLPSHTHSISISSHSHSVTIPSHTHNVSLPSHTHSVSLPSHTHSVSIPSHSHNVTLPSHTHKVTTSNHTHSVTIGNHNHTVKINDHTHSVTIGNHNHTVKINDHTHSVTIPSHTHGVTIPSHTHKVTLPDHTHGIVYGIYEGTTASSCTLKVDGNTVQSGVRSGNDVDLIPYMSKNEEGKINRGVWHTVEIVPDQMSRIEAALFVKTFITSYTGGNY